MREPHQHRINNSAGTTRSLDGAGHVAAGSMMADCKSSVCPSPPHHSKVNGTALASRSADHLSDVEESRCRVEPREHSARASLHSAIVTLVPATVHLHDLTRHIPAHRRIIERTSGPFDTTFSTVQPSVPPYATARSTDGCAYSRGVPHRPQRIPAVVTSRVPAVRRDPMFHRPPAR